MLPASTAFVRQFSRKCSPNLRKINAKVPPQEATAIAAGLYRILKDHGPLTVSHTWNHAKKWKKVMLWLSVPLREPGSYIYFVLLGSVARHKTNILQSPLCPSC